MATFDSIHHFHTLFPHQRTPDGKQSPYPPAYESLAAMSATLGYQAQVPSPELAIMLNNLREVDQLYVTRLHEVTNVHDAYYAILSHHMAMCYGLLECAAALAHDETGPESFNIREDDLIAKMHKAGSHLNRAQLAISGEHDPQKSLAELGNDKEGLSMTIAGMKSWLEENITQFEAGKARHPDSKEFYRMAELFLFEAEEHITHWKHVLAQSPQRPDPDQKPPLATIATPVIKSKHTVPPFTIPTPVFSLLPELYRCKYGQSPHQIPEYVKQLLNSHFTTDRPNLLVSEADVERSRTPLPPLQMAVRNIRTFEEGYISQINEAETIDEAYLHILHHHLATSVSLVHLASILGKTDGPEKTLFDAKHTDESQAHCVTQLNRMFTHACHLRDMLDDTTPPDARDLSAPREKVDQLREALFVGIQGKINEIDHALQLEPTGDQPPLQKHSKEILETAREFLQDAQDHLANWQLSLLEHRPPQRSGGVNQGNTRA